MLKYPSLGLAAVLLLGSTARAETSLAGAASGVSGASVVQALLGLAVVLAMVGIAAWLLKRFVALRGSGVGPIRVIAAAAVGPRERLVMVEVGETWLLVGVAPGQIRTLHSMPRSETPALTGVPSPLPAGAAFASWLHRVRERRSDD
jgi:flagellar protein FliO/FliZ